MTIDIKNEENYSKRKKNRLQPMSTKENKK